jgi:hypothetical protein
LKIWNESSWNKAMVMVFLARDDTTGFFDTELKDSLRFDELLVLIE